MKGNGTFLPLFSMMSSSFRVWNAIHTLISSKRYLHPNFVPKFHMHIPNFALGCLTYILNLQSPKPKLLTSLQIFVPLTFFLISVNDKSIFLTQYEILETWISCSHISYPLPLQILLLFPSEHIRTWPHLILSSRLQPGLSHHCVLSAFILFSQTYTVF